MREIQDLIRIKKEKKLSLITYFIFENANIKNEEYFIIVFSFFGLFNIDYFLLLFLISYSKKFFIFFFYSIRATVEFY